MNEPVAFYQVDAFADRPFAGNPAAVCLYETWLPDDLMQAIAAENNLSETAFVVPEGDDWGLRWFTPTTEVDLCGHATLAAAAVILEDVDPEASHVLFLTPSGPLGVGRDEGRYALDFPSIPPLPLDGEPSAALLEGLRATPATVLDAGPSLLAVFDRAADVAALDPDFVRLRDLGSHSVIATAPGEGPDVDFVSRFFGPNVGVDEDPVTGSAHCTLAPYWGDRLDRKKLHARQISARGGTLVVEDRGARVTIWGHAVIVIRGELFV
ncbi:MAG: PhzF family phenazine biosynthesis protein [Planctomycetota bacterium]|nr:PhzF family phenazine biosynthesis protein [Planctomycetota bacterium]